MLQWVTNLGTLDATPDLSVDESHLLSRLHSEGRDVHTETIARQHNAQSNHVV
jgi:hypothetical protein